MHVYCVIIAIESSAAASVQTLMLLEWKLCRTFELVTDPTASLQSLSSNFEFTSAPPVRKSYCHLNLKSPWSTTKFSAREFMINLKNALKCVLVPI